MNKTKKTPLDARALGDLLRLACKAKEDGRTIVSISAEDLIDLVHIAQSAHRGPGLFPKRNRA